MQPVFHVTVLSNFSRAFDKYSRTYDKSKILESTFPDKFFVLFSDQLHIGVEKATRLLKKMNLSGDRLLVMKSTIDTNDLKNDHESGVGHYISGAKFRVDELFYLEGETRPEVSIEEAYAASLNVNGSLAPYNTLKPRTLSVLPVARACQASCLFCFSESSASLDQNNCPIDLKHVVNACERAKAAGAERFVITGGGEPTLIKESDLLELIKTARQYFPKVVLITNGIRIGKVNGWLATTILRRYARAGLTTLAVSRHHYDAKENQRIMGIDTQTEKVIEAWNEERKYTDLQLRLICVLQKGGVDSRETLEEYLNWATQHEIPEVCFKELYVSSTLESQYVGAKENQWSKEHQVSLELVTSSLADMGFEVIGRLPWGAPIFEGHTKFGPIKVAAYTEPSMFWERANGICRSWNIMADGTVLASLEDPTSIIEITNELR